MKSEQRRSLFECKSLEAFTNSHNMDIEDAAALMGGGAQSVNNVKPTFTNKYKQLLHLG
jgi:hypothetical protein